MEAVMRADKFGRKGLTFSDVLLVPAYSEVLPGQVDVTTRLTNNISLNIPVISAGMDTVTETAMAVAMAREGGLGVIHSNMSIGEECREVQLVKRSEHGVVVDPVCLSPDDMLSDADDLMNKYHISGVPITEDGKLVGIITIRDMRFETNLSKPISEVMTSEGLVTAPEHTSLRDAKKILQAHRIEKLPLVDSKGYLKGLITIGDIEKTKKYPNAVKDKEGRLLVGASTGSSDDAEERGRALLKAGADVLFVEALHGGAKRTLEIVRNLRKSAPDAEIVAGNAATYDAAKALIEAGASDVKVGVGPGSVGTTSVIAGVGVPQVTAIYDCARACEEAGIPVIADGGMRYSGDIAKAIGAGASCVMLGNLLAGTDECPGEMVIFQGRNYKLYRGMDSAGAFRAAGSGRFFGGVLEKTAPEGIEGRVPYKGHVSDVLFQLSGGLKAAMSYCGAKDIAAMREEAQFIQITSASLDESHPHDVMITKEAPNYSAK